MPSSSHGKMRHEIRLYHKNKYSGPSFIQTLNIRVLALSGRGVCVLHLLPTIAFWDTWLLLHVSDGYFEQSDEKKVHSAVTS